MTWRTSIKTVFYWDCSLVKEKKNLRWSVPAACYEPQLHFIVRWPLVAVIIMTGTSHIVPVRCGRMDHNTRSPNLYFISTVTDPQCKLWVHYCNHDNKGSTNPTRTTIFPSSFCACLTKPRLFHKRNCVLITVRRRTKVCCAANRRLYSELICRRKKKTRTDTTLRLY